MTTNLLTTTLQLQVRRYDAQTLCCDTGGDPRERLSQADDQLKTIREALSKAGIAARAYQFTAGHLVVDPPAASIAEEHARIPRQQRYSLDRFPEIISKLAGMVDRFTTTLDCFDVGFLPDDTLDELPLPSQIGATRVGGVDLNKPRIRATLAAVLALTAATTSSHPSALASEAPEWAANPPTGPASTATTKPSASTCKPSFHDLGITTTEAAAA